MESKQSRALWALTLVALLTVSSIGVVTIASAPAVAAESNTTTTGTPASCSDPGSVGMDQARLFAPDKTITTDSPGRIDGGFQLANGIDCEVMVEVTLRVPSGVTISGGSDWGSEGAGIVTSTFTLTSDSGIKDLSANVYSDTTGEKRVTGDIEYWAAGHADQSKEIDGLTFTFDVESPSNSTDSGNGTDPDPIWIIFGAFGLVALGIIGMMYVSPKFKMVGKK